MPVQPDIGIEMQDYSATMKCFSSYLYLVGQFPGRSDNDRIWLIWNSLVFRHLFIPVNLLYDWKQERQCLTATYKPQL